jgi:hypothetical protein
MVSFDLAFRQHPDVELTDLGDALVLTLGKTSFGVNGAGRRIVQLLAEPRTLHSLVDLIVGEFAVERPQGEQDLREFLTELGERGLIVNT